MRYVLLISIAAATALAAGLAFRVTTLSRNLLMHSQRAGPAPPPEGADLFFIENAGQFPEEARFQVRGCPSLVWLAREAIWITVLGAPTKQGGRWGDREQCPPLPDLPRSTARSGRAFET